MGRIRAPERRGLAEEASFLRGSVPSAMRPRSLLVCVALCLLAVAPAALAVPPSKGPFAGLVAEGEWREHPYTNHPNPDFACPVYPWGWSRPYTLTLTYEPPTDRVDLAFPPFYAVGSNGVALLRFEGPDCLSGSVWARGVSTTGPVAAYEIAVVDGPGTDALEDILRP